MGGGQASLLTTMNSNQNLRKGNVSVNMNKFGTSDNFQTGSYAINNTVPKRANQGRMRDPDSYDNRTDGFKNHPKYENRQRHGASPSPVPHQFISEPSQAGINEPDEEDEEQIEEDIQMGAHDSPMINAHTKEMRGKAKALFPAHQPPIFQSTESERFNLDTMTGFN